MQHLWIQKKSNYISVVYLQEGYNLDSLVYILQHWKEYKKIILQNSPVSYLFDHLESVEFFRTGIHVPRFLNLGNVSLATKLSEQNITFRNPLTMCGCEITGDRLKAYKAEFEQMRKITNQDGKTISN